MNPESLPSIYFHRSTKFEKFTKRPLPWSKWPTEWKEVYFKTYPRLPRIPLAPYLTKLPNIPLDKVLSMRRSIRKFLRKPVTPKQLSGLLYYSAGIKNLPRHYQNKDWQQSRRFYPSSGARYPLEIYPLVLRGTDNVPSGLYHYNVKEHSLELLGDRRYLSDKLLEGTLMYPWSRRAPLILFITAIFWRNQIKYGDRGYRYILQESGHLGQNLYLVGEALLLNCCALGGFADYEVDKILDIDGVTETAIYALAVGVKEEGRI